MNLKDLPSNRKEKIFYKIQEYSMNCWNELPKTYSSLESARDKFNETANTRIVKRSDNGWEIMEQTR